MKLITKFLNPYQLIALPGKPANDITYEQRLKRLQRESSINGLKNIAKGIDNTFGTAAALASLIYNGGWALNRLIRKNKASTLGLNLAKYYFTAQKADNIGDAASFIANPSISGAVDLTTGVILSRNKDLLKKSRQAAELIGQGANVYNLTK